MILVAFLAVGFLARQSGGVDALQCCTAVPMVAAASAGNSTSVGELVSSTMYLLLSVTFCYFLLLSVTFCYFLLLSVVFCYFLLLSVTFSYFLAILFCLVNMCFWFLHAMLAIVFCLALFITCSS